MNQVTAKIIEIKKLTAEISEFVLQLSEKIEFKPGQFVMLQIPPVENKIVRAYSVVSYNSDSWKLTLAIKFTGWTWTTWLFKRKLWDEVLLSWAFWHFFVKNEKENLNFFATGIGLPPLVCQLTDLFKNWTEKKINLFFGLRTSKDLYYTAFLEKLAKVNSNFHFHYCLSREEKDWTFNGYVTNHPELEKIDWVNSEAYYCGSVPVVKDLKEKLFWLGLEKKFFVSEAF